jgi:hypothetical protein
MWESQDESEYDFYTWEGKFVRRADPNGWLISRDGRYYVSNQPRRIVQQDGIVTGTFPSFLDSAPVWASDAHMVCGIQGTTLIMIDVHGVIRRVQTDLAHEGGIYTCSAGTGRVAVYEGPYFAVVAMSDGHTIVTEPLRSGAAGYTFAPDVMTLMEPMQLAHGAVAADLIELSPGGRVVRLSGVTPTGFSPDTRYVVVTDPAEHMIREVDWRTGSEVWGTPGWTTGPTDSDPTTNMMLLEIDASESTPVRHFFLVSAGHEVNPFTPLR